MDHASSVPPAGITLTLLTPIRYNFKPPFCLCSDWGLKATVVIWPKDNTAKGAEHLGPWGPRPNLQGQAVPAILLWGPHSLRVVGGGQRKDSST